MRRFKLCFVLFDILRKPFLGSRESSVSVQRGVADSSSIFDAANGAIHTSGSAAVDDVQSTSSQAPVQPVLPSKVSSFLRRNF